LKKVKRVPVYIGSKKEMLSEKKRVLKKHPHTKINLVSVKYPKGMCELRVSKRMYRKLIDEEERTANQWRRKKH